MTVMPLPLEKVPAVQMEHWVATVRPLPVLYVPAPH